MSSNSTTYKATLQLISDILSYENSDSALKQKINANTIDWEQFVIVASDYLVLTTCFCRLQEKKLLEFIPEDLTAYLEEITAINRNRNQSLLSEIGRISKILKTENIRHVFLKGSAFLAKGLYRDSGERMLGDIDILVDEHHLNKTYQILMSNGYSGTEQDITSKYFDFKHLPRLQSETYLAAVEVHKKLTSKSYHDLLSPERILDNLEQANGICIPSKDHMYYHTVLNFQVNDQGFLYNRISLKSIYDILVLRKTYGDDFNSVNELAYFKGYYSIAKLFFQDFKDYKSNKFVDRLFLLKLKHPKFRHSLDALIRKTKYLKTIISSRILFFIRNKNYRTDIIKDYKRILGLRKLKKF